MLIKRLDISGFKSFGSRKAFKFDDGISAIVGPNGSGKSNIADAIRWVLGEQKNKRLRVSKSEDLIFHGTNKIPKASMAEVSILFDNSKNIFPIDSSEILISRKFLRSGESEYKLNGKKVRLSKLEELLAESGFGTESYTVVSQGAIDKLVTSSGLDRKRLFDEASGIRQYDIRYKEAQLKLDKSMRNYENIKVLLKEIIPIAEALRDQTEGIDDLSVLENELSILRSDYITSELKRYKNKLLKNKEELKDYQARFRSIKQELNLIYSKKRSFYNQDTNDLTQALRSLEIERDNLNQKILLLQSEQNVVKAKLDIVISDKSKSSDDYSILNKLQFDLKLLVKARDDHSKLIKKNDKEIALIEDKILGFTNHLSSMKDKLSKNQRSEYLNHAYGIVQMIRTQLRQSSSKKQVDTSLKKLSDILEIAKQENPEEIALKIVEVQNQIGRYMAQREDIVEKQTQEVIRLRSIEIDIASLESQIKQFNKSFNEDIKAKEEYNKKLKSYDVKISSIKIEIEDLSNAIKSKREEIDNRSGNKNSEEQLAMIQNVEKLASEKAELEFLISRNQEEKAELLNSLKEISSKSISWFGRVLKETNNYQEKVDESELELVTKKIEKIKSINPELVRESIQSSEKVKFLQEQEIDLVKAIKDTEKLLERLQNNINNKFNKSFIHLNNEFGKYFEKIFPGGTAEIKLENNINNEYVIEIYANPAGKRSKNINILSGGEKAMTSIALIAAIISVNPSPFIVLDEVDAALDDENSTKFCEILEILSKKSQVILITHNHETMQSALNLYGITSGPKGDSEVLQVSLEQASKLVEV